MQVSAFSAAMEVVRSERAGGFANQLFGGLLRAALAADAASGALVGVIVNKFIACLDVRSVAGGQIQFWLGFVAQLPGWAGSVLARRPCVEPAEGPASPMVHSEASWSSPSGLGCAGITPWSPCGTWRKRQLLS